jgi:hypothetical protein
MNYLTQFRIAARLFLPLCALGSFAICESVQAVVPGPDGGYPGFTTAEGTNALQNLTTGVGNTAAGWYSLFTNTSGSYNTGVGAGTLLFNIGDPKGAGSQNTAIGTAALLFNTAGSCNTAAGVTALLNNTEGANNTAIGEQALYTNTIGFSNTAVGAFALFSNSADTDRNTAIGAEALFSNASGHENTANGAFALHDNTTGSHNTAIGKSALETNTANDNTAVGWAALDNNTIGSHNTAMGVLALSEIPTTIRPSDMVRFLVTRLASAKRPLVAVRLLLTPQVSGTRLPARLLLKIILPALIIRPAGSRRYLPTTVATTTRSAGHSPSKTVLETRTQVTALMHLLPIQLATAIQRLVLAHSLVARRGRRTSV